MIILPSFANSRLDRWMDAPRGSWRLHVRVLAHAATAMTVIYLTGWGPALGVCFVYAAKLAHASTVALLLGATPIFIGLITVVLRLEGLSASGDDGHAGG